MKLECTIEKLKHALELVSGTVSKQAVSPLLQNIYIEAEQHIVIFRSTTIDTSSEIRIPVKVQESGKCLIHGETLTKLVQSIVTQEKNVSLSTVDGTFVVEYGKNTHVLKMTPFEDFPHLPNISENSIKISVPVEKMIEGISSVAFAAAQSDLKPEIASVYVYGSENEVFFVSTDSYRLAEKKIRLSGCDQLNLLIPFKVVPDLLKILKHFTKDVDVEFNKNTLLIRDEFQVVHIRLIDGIFPNYRQIIPTSSSTTMKVLKHDIQNMLRTLSLFTDRYNQISLSMVPDEKGCLVRTENGEIGSSVQFIDALIEGEPLVLSLNSKYLGDVLGMLLKESVIFECTSPQRPIIVKSLADASFVYLIMPLSR